MAQPIPNLSDWPLTHLGCQPTSHFLSQTLVCSHYLALLDTLDPPCLHFDLQCSALTQLHVPDFRTLSLTAV